MVLDTDWPGNSPDLNVIENFNSEQKARLAVKDFHSSHDLKVAAWAAWAAIPQEEIRHAFDHMPDRLAAVNKAAGGNTRY